MRLSSKIKVRYCSLACQTDHFRRGHEQICEEMYRGGNAEQYHADKKYKEAVAVAVDRGVDAKEHVRRHLNARRGVVDASLETRHRGAVSTPDPRRPWA